MGSRAKHRQKDLVKKEIAVLFVSAAQANAETARSAIRKARKIAERNRISLREYNKRHCRKCCTYWKADTYRVRTTPQAVVYTCLYCHEKKRFRKQ